MYRHPYAHIQPQKSRPAHAPYNLLFYWHKCLHLLRIEETLYFTNSARSLFASVPINLDKTPRGPAGFITKFTALLPGSDDFTIDEIDDVSITTSRGNTMNEVANNGSQKVVARNLYRTEIAQPTGARFGRERDGKRVLYVTTAGGLAAPVDVKGNETVVRG